MKSQILLLLLQQRYQLIQLAPQNIRLSDSFGGFAFEVFAGTQNTKSDSDKSTTVDGIVTTNIAIKHRRY